MGCCCGKTEDLKSGTIDPEKPRGCTDIPSLIIFILFWCGMIVVAAFSAVQGDPWRLIYGADSYGNTCGRRNSEVKGLNMSGYDLRKKQYLFPMDITNPFDSLWICVESCPQYTLYRPETLQSYAETYGAHYCSYEIPTDQYSNVTVPFSNLGPCPILPVYASTPVMHRCIPTAAISLSKEIFERIFGFLNRVDVFQQVLSDLIISYKEILIMCIVAFIIALLVVFVIRFVAGIIVYLIFGMVLTGGLAVTVVLWYAYANLRLHLDTSDLVSNGTRLLISDTKNEHTLLIYAIAATVVTTLLIVVVICMWRSAKLVVDLFQQAGRCLQATPCLLLQPLYTFVCLMVLFVYWSLVVLLLATASEMSKERATSLPPAYVEFLIVDYNVTSSIRYMWWYHLIGLIWTAEFILACQQLVVASSVAMWYFSRDKSNVGCTICKSIKRLFLYHMGSVALGSFIITLVKIPRMILMYIKSKLKNAKAPWAAYILKCCICCLWCIERCCKYLHHNAYTIIAIEGTSFCPAAKQAFEILANNVARVSAINLVGDFVLFLGKCGVTAFTGLIALLVLRGNDQLHYYSVPLLLICVFAFFIAHCFFSVYEMAIDTLFLCYCADRDFHDSSGAILFADEGLIEFMAESKRREQPDTSDDPESQPMRTEL